MKAKRTNKTRRVIATIGIAATALFATAAVATVSSPAAPTTSGASIILCDNAWSCPETGQGGTQQNCYYGDGTSGSVTVIGIGECSDGNVGNRCADYCPGSSGGNWDWWGGHLYDL